MSRWEGAKRALVDRFRRETVIAGPPESIAQQTGFSGREVEEALTELISENLVRPFQDARGYIHYEWKAPPGG